MILPLIAVKNYAAAKKFYTEKLGFTSTLDMFGKEGENTFGFVELGKGAQIGLSQDSSDLTGRGNGVVLMLYPPDFDIDAYYNKVKAAGANIVEEIRTEVWGDRLFAVKDVDGYYITFTKTVEAMRPVEEIKEELRKQNQS